MTDNGFSEEIEQNLNINRSGIYIPKDKTKNKVTKPPIHSNDSRISKQFIKKEDIDDTVSYRTEKHENSDATDNKYLSLVFKNANENKKILNTFILDFLEKSDMRETAEHFKEENQENIMEHFDKASNSEEENILEAFKIKRSFLNEWWQIFWDVFNAKAHKNGSKIAQEYYSFNVSRQNLDFLCRQASMKAAFEQQIFERRGEYQMEALRQHSDMPAMNNQQVPSKIPTSSALNSTVNNTTNMYSPPKNKTAPVNSAQEGSQQQQMQELQKQQILQVQKQQMQQIQQLQQQLQHQKQMNQMHQQTYQMNPPSAGEGSRTTSKVPGLSNQQMVQQRLAKVSPMVSPDYNNKAIMQKAGVQNYSSAIKQNHTNIPSFTDQQLENDFGSMHENTMRAPALDNFMSTEIAKDHPHM